MNDHVLAKLRALLEEHGEGLYADPEHCRHLLDQALPAWRREANVLLAAVTRQAVADLLDARDEQTVLMLLAPSAERLADETAMALPAAQWSVRTWALALGLVSASALGRRRDEPKGAVGALWSARTWIRIFLLAALGAALITASARWFQPVAIGLPPVAIPRVAEPARHNVGREGALALPDASLRCVAASPDGRTAACGGRGGAWLWDLDRGSRVRRLPVARGREVVCLAFGRDGRLLLGGTAPCGQSRSRPGAAPDASGGGEMVLWDLSDGRVVRRFGGHAGGVRCVAFTPDGGKVLSGDGGGRVRVWDVSSGAEALVLRGHADGMLSLAVSADGRLALSSGADATVRLWDLRSGRQAHEMSVTGAPALAVAFRGNEPRVLAGERAGERADEQFHRITVWALRGQGPADANETYARRRLAAFATRRGCAGPNAAAFCKDASFFALREDDGLVHLWEIASQREIARFRSLPACRLALGPQKWRVLLIGGGFLRVWRLPERWVGTCIEPDAARVSMLAFSRDSRRLIAWDPEGKTEAWDVPGGRKHVATARDAKPFTPPAVSPREHQLVAEEDGSLRLWNVATRKQVVRFEGHRGKVTSSVFSARCDLAMSGGADGTVRLWDVRAPSALARFEGHEGAVTNVALSPDGRFAASAGRDGTVRLWGVPGEGAQPTTKAKP